VLIGSFAVAGGFIAVLLQNVEGFTRWGRSAASAVHLLRLSIYAVIVVPTTCVIVGEPNASYPERHGSGSNPKRPSVATHRRQPSTRADDGSALP
jgi:hypothetical protein